MKTKSLTTLVASIGVVLWMILLTGSCGSGPEPIRYGQDNCTHCKMTLTDKRFGSEIITAKGKVFKFDDLNCLVAYLDGGDFPEADVAQIVAIDFAKTGAFVDVQKAFFLQNEAIKSPMRADIAAFSDPTDLAKVKAEVSGGQEMNWEAVRKSFK